MLIKEIKYSYSDVNVIPAITTDMCHRSEPNPFTEEGLLPIFAAPMDTVVSENNYELFLKNKITPILPRNYSLETRISYAINNKWAAFSLEEFVNNFSEGNKYEGKKIKALVDIANGHMECMYEAVKGAKHTYGENITIMVGNVARPETYKVAYEAGADFIRFSIGTGEVCITASNTAIHYPIASLIDEAKKIKNTLISEGADENKLPKIIADGGIRNYSDVMKALALGADYVMIGGIFASFLESASPIINKQFFQGYDLENAKFYKDKTVVGNVTIRETVQKLYYGMASKRGQMSISGSATKTAEGIEKVINVRYHMSGWVENMEHYLRSNMTYVNAHTLHELKNNTDLVLVSQGTKDSVNK